MNEITRIHLAKTPYSIELSAKTDLEKYIKAIGAHMHTDDDVMREIEARMVELLAERGVMADQVITHEDVTALREQLGEPKAFADDESSEQAVETSEEVVEKPEKRFMRDVDNAVLGGVCAGIAEYFHLDVLLVRLLTVAGFILSAGTLVFIYIIFWIITPPARTRADKLKMAGKPVTLEALKDSVENEKPAGISTAAKIRRAFFGTIALVTMAGVLIGVIVGGYLGYDMVSWMGDFQAQPWAMGMLASLFIGGIALVILLGLLSVSAFSNKVAKPTWIAMLAMIFIGVIGICGVAITGVQTRNFMQHDLKRLTKVENLPLTGDLSHITQADVAGAQLVYGNSADKTVRAEVSYLGVHGATKPSVQIENQGDKLIFRVEDTRKDCPAMLYSGYCAGMTPIITVYGLNQPAQAESYVGQQLFVP